MFSVSCFRNDRIKHVSAYVSDPEAQIQTQGVYSGNGGSPGKEGGSREVS